MATTENTFTGNGSTTNYSFTFPYIKTTDVKASINGTDTTAFTLANATTVQFNTAPANSAAIRIYRGTDDSALPATFYAGSSIKSSDLNDNFLQNLYSNQEGTNNSWTSGTKTIESSETWVGNNTKVATTGAIDGRVDAKIDTAMGSDVLAGTDLIKTVSGGQVTVAHNVNGANSTVNNSNGNVIQDITISAQGHVTSVASTNLDGRYYTETETGSLIDSKIDTAVTTDILAGQSITKTNGSGQVTISIANSAIGTNQIADDAVTLAKLGSGALPTDITVASANIVNGTIVAADISTGTLDGRYYTETELDAGQLDNRYYTETELNAGQLDNRYYTETELNAGQLDSRYYTETEADARFYNLTSGEEIQSGETWAAADNKIATTAAIDARITDLVDDVGGFVPIANETSFPNANPDINNGAGTLVSIKALSSNLTSNGSGVATIANGTVGNSTVTITGLANSTTYSSTYGMIVETTTTLNTYTFHRQVPIATEVTTVASNISNINSVANNSSNINSAVSNASNINSAVSNASNINSVAGNISNVNTVAGNNTNINTVAGANSNISTVSTNITNVNNVGGSISNVNTVAGNLSGVNSFGERYRVASSAPGSGNDEGDLYFDTTANELKVYNGSAWQGGVTASGNFASTTGNTFTGNNTYQDNVKAQFGTSNDLQIYHDGSNSIIKNTTGDLIIEDTGGNLIFRPKTGEDAIKAYADGAVELYYDNSKKFETTSAGSTLSGDLLLDSASAEINLKSGVGTESGAINWTFNTAGTNYGRISLPYDTRATLGLNIHSGYPITLTGGNSNETLAKFTQNGSNELYYDNSKKLETTSGGVAITGDLTLGTFRVASSSGNVWMGDNDQLRFGDGEDLRIYHDGSNSTIYNATGTTVFRADELHFNNAANTENKIKAVNNAQVELYYDNSKKFETMSTGTKTNGYHFVSNPGGTAYLEVGQGATDNRYAHIDLVGDTTYNDYGFRILRGNSGPNTTSNIYHRGTGSFNITCVDNGELRFLTNNSIRWRIDNGGDLRNLSDSYKLKLGASDDLQIYHDGSHTYIDNNVGNLYIRNNVAGDVGGDIHIRAASNENGISVLDDSEVRLSFDGAEKLNTYSGGVEISGNLNISSELNLVGGSDANKYLDAQVGTNAFTIRKVTGGDTGHETMAYFKGDAECALYYDNSLKLNTNSTGVGITGNVTPVTTNTYNLGSSSYRWNNLYVNDMHFSNHPENPNSVDGTWGDWTLQEGENDIYMLNNRTGKKYKMALTEVS